jgi:CspA family cold shock protein
MPVGTVKLFNAQMGFGLIAPDERGADIFFHVSAVEQAGLTTLHEGQRVSFDEVMDQKRGKKAQNLKAV